MVQPRLSPFNIVRVVIKVGSNWMPIGTSHLSIGHLLAIYPTIDPRRVCDFKKTLSRFPFFCVEARKRGWNRAEKKVVIGDGAEWEIQIVDLVHARQHLWDLARKLHPNQQLEQKRWMTIHRNMLDEGRIEGLVAALHSIGSSNLELAETIRKEAAYFETHTAGMRYPEVRNQHLFVGSGVIEAGCKTVIGSRFKQSGMFWSVRGANGILALRCCHHNGQFEDYWESRAA